MHLTRLEKTQKGSSTKGGLVFVSAMETALHLCDWHDVTLHAQYLHLTKADIVKIRHQARGRLLPNLDLLQGRGPRLRVVRFLHGAAGGVPGGGGRGPGGVRVKIQ